MTSKKVLPFKSKKSETPVSVPGNDAEEFETIVLEPRPMPDFIEPLFAHPAAEPDFLITDDDGHEIELSQEQLRELAEWVLSGGIDE